jgi:hypothetical protein
VWDELAARCSNELLTNLVTFVNRAIAFPFE